ncbi:ATP-dependent DNA helicase RecG [Arthrobacter mobilis]|uniref:Probable DNA 3'-5' helicase RecG n=1 Tax=Arthrobacter mobilis TaxID=2724944 RepID=A0A7X6K558_9MICC|nr:ATP-dependent DNA helicase RecG [Arthrobacter mobilis]NKX55345.1 ATP-dependent DNA helicase RecG [Arthrobacter mobilis]
MDDRRPAELDLPLERRLGKRTAAALQKHLGLTRTGELLNYFPRRYLKRGELTLIADLPPDEDATLVARVLSCSTRRMRARRGSLTEVVITDNSTYGNLSLTFFNGYQAERDLRPGTLAMFSGKVTRYQGRLTLTNPDYALLEDAADFNAEEALRPVPLYPATAKLGSWRIKSAVEILLDSVDFTRVGDPVPPDIAIRDGLLSLPDAYQQIHRPATIEDARRARERFRYQEALVLQAALARRRAQATAEEATARPAVAGGLLDRFDAALPFTLTNGQREVGATVAGELAANHPMNRLLQGEVGSGKTLVALRAMLQVIDAGGQAALLAPTEVLAAQHYESIRRTLGPLAEAGLLGGDEAGTRVVLITGSVTGAARRRALLEVASGEAGIVIGTHALLSDEVMFADLGLIVVDEQHRFGVEQRDRLRSRAARPPHLLVMTATPIPRTVAMTVFGDLETSVLSELPAGRAPIATHLVGLVEHPGWEARIWERAREEVDAGRQVYVVCPKIGDEDREDTDPFDAPPPEEETRELAAVVSTAEYLATVPALAGVRTGVLHGRQDPEAKAATMAAFNDGRLDLLVSTTVIEVGVDVPNATLMVVLDADRFGISQLHQLRGRVGRGGLPGTCLLVTRLEPGHPSRARLDAVARTTDGFELSQADLLLRREGDILGSSQSGGKSTLKLLRVITDEDVIATARADAAGIVAHDAQLAQYPELAQAIELYLNPEKEAFLERG